MVEPRFRWVPDRIRSLGPDCIALWLDAGGMLFAWQKQAIDGILGLDDDDRFVTGNDGLTLARQNGKGVVLQAIEIYFAVELGYPVVMHTAHEFATSQEHQLRLEQFIQDCPHLHAKVKAKGGYVHANGQESIRFKSGARIIFKARTKGGGRGYSGDLLVWDEAMVIPESVVGAQKPMLRASRAKHGPKTIYSGSAVDQALHPYGIPFALIRERGLASTPSVSYHEWSAPYDDPVEMTDAVLRDRSWWPLANPSMPEGLIAESHMAEEIESMVGRTAAVELGCVGDWPRTDGLEDSLIDPATWAALIDPRSKPIDPVALAFDVRPDRAQTVIAAVGTRKDNLIHAEIVDQRSGTGWLVDRIVELKNAHEPLGIAADSVGPAASLVMELKQRGVTVTALNTRQYAQACGLFFDLVEREGLRHLGQPELASAVRAAAKRDLSDAWAWSRKNSAGDISPLVAATLAYWLAVAEPTSRYEDRGMVELSAA